MTAESRTDSSRSSACTLPMAAANLVGASGLPWLNETDWNFSRGQLLLLACVDFAFRAAIVGLGHFRLSA